MSLVHICCNWAGTSVYHDLFSQLAQRGLAQQVYVPEKRAGDMGKRPSGESNLTVAYSLIVRPWDRVLYYTKGRRAALDLPGHIDLAGVSLVHAHTLFTDGAVALRLKARFGLPYVVSVRSTDLEAFYPLMPHLRGYGLRILREAEAVHFLSPAYRDRLLADYIPKPHQAEILQKSRVLPNGIDPAWFADQPKAYGPGEPVCLAFAGKLARIKHPQAVLAAGQALADLLPGTEVTLAFAGEGPEKDRLARAGRRSGLGVCLPGRLGGIEALKAFYDRSTLFLMPSGRESFGLVYLEAMSRGLPVFFTRGQGFDGVFPPGTNGAAVDPRDPAGMARAMAEVLGRYQAVSRWNLEAVRPFAWPQVAGRYFDLYEALSPGLAEGEVRHGY